MKTFALVLMLAVTVPLTVFAAEAPVAKEAAGTEEAQVVDAGNKYCPVMGGPVSGKDYYVYNGKRYGFCCPGCIEPFKVDPEKYLAKMAETESAGK